MRTVTIVHHRVADFDAWKAVYDGFAGTQREGGVMEHAVLCPADDPGMVVVVHTFATADAARAFFERQDLRDTMVAAGVAPDSVRVEMLDEVVAGGR